MDNEVKQFRYDLAQMCWYMRGGVTLDEMFASSYDDREAFVKIIQKNMETTKKTNLPFF